MSAAQAASPAVDVRAFGRVGVLFGGRSAEREISLLSGNAVLQALQQAGVDAHPFDPAEASLAALEAERFDRVFLVLHGRFGEDGTIQGVLETLRVPYTGSGVQASAIAMDKAMTKRIWEAEGLPTPAWRCVGVDEAGQASHAGLASLGAELVVKPVSEGSAIGVAKVKAGDGAALAAAIAAAGAYDARVLVEERIVGRELTCALLGEGDATQALPLVEIQAPGANYDYHHKYFSDETRYLCPAPVAPELAQRIGRTCVRAYRAVGARGWGRIDVMLRGPAGAEEPCLLELNTTPGMTAHSLVPMAAREAGLPFEALVLRILAGARLETRA